MGMGDLYNKHREKIEPFLIFLFISVITPWSLRYAGREPSAVHDGKFDDFPLMFFASPSMELTLLKAINLSTLIIAIIFYCTKDLVSHLARVVAVVITASLYIYFEHYRNGFSPVLASYLLSLSMTFFFFVYDYVLSRTAKDERIRRTLRFSSIGVSMPTLASLLLCLVINLRFGDHNAAMLFLAGASSAIMFLSNAVLACGGFAVPAPSSPQP